MTAPCGANGRGGKPCQQPSGFGTSHAGIGRCKFHGGSTPTQETGAVRAAAGIALERMGLSVEKHPDQALLDLVYEAAGNVAFLREQAGEYGTNVYRMLTSTRPDGTVTELGESERAIVKLYGEWSDRLAKYAKAAIDAGIAKRYVEMAEAQAAAIVRIIHAVLNGLPLSAEQRETGIAIARRELLLIDGGKAA